MNTDMLYLPQGVLQPSSQSIGMDQLLLPLETSVEGKKMFQCPICPYMSIKHPHVITHIRVHTGEKPFKCAHCPWRTKQRCHLRAHILKNHPFNNFMCTICKFIADSLEQLYMHKQSTHRWMISGGNGC